MAVEPSPAFRLLTVPLLCELLIQLNTFQLFLRSYRGQIANAVAYQRMLQRYSSYSHKPPSIGQLMAVALASGLPFFG